MVKSMKKILFSIILGNFLILVNAQVTDIANVSVPGTLNTIAKAYLKTVTNLTVKGFIDARDFKTMRDSMTSLVVLNLDSAKIAAYTGKFGTQDSNNDTYTANAIPQYSFYNQQTQQGKNLTSVVFPNNITEIGTYSFYNNINLKDTLTIPDSVTSVGDYAFAYCYGLTSLSISPSINYLGDFAFFYCFNITGNLIIPPLVNFIGIDAFSNCNFTGTVTIPSSVTYIGLYAFSSCAVSNIVVDEANLLYSSLNGVLYNKNKTTLI
jgi:hypothetical protein